ncbi:N-acetylmuramoyl-L-alanine amidase [Thermoflavifilum aggregans]|uniref:N-acetylmuramoyl-L-alanine amidase n=1 Tax=Thermoflavifilum aggregans TaxID=454188 RepID=A0A2M9CWG7_9BACT|nr:N-acetylmuramoyl-L-alanine amidase [Thermoflavifilum aggregans]PJJ76240.1 N-acetylmuramoyl-L-alanine amidase [Thermoflavifilum aggregans]
MPGFKMIGFGIVLWMSWCMWMFPSRCFAQADTDRKFIVVLDAGHGGSDVGARGSFSLEKNVALAITLKLGQLLEQTQPDVKVVYTRTTDTYPALYERADLANKVHADLFISIHCNSMPYHRVLVGHRYVKRNGKRVRVPIYKMVRSDTETGTETYVLGLHRMGQKTQAIESEMEADSNDVEARENAYIVHEKNYQQNYGGFDPSKPETYILLALHSSAYLSQSIAFADSVEQEFKRVGRPSRGVKQKGLAVLAGTAMPAVLVETGFINNPREEKYLNSPEGQLEIAQCIARAIEKYKQAVWKYRSLVNTVHESFATDAPATPVYRIQLLVSSHYYQPDDRIFQHLGMPVDIEDTTINQQKAYRYLTGRFLQRDSAEQKLDFVRQIGFKDAFIVVYQQGSRVNP